MKALNTKGVKMLKYFKGRFGLIGAFTFSTFLIFYYQNCAQVKFSNAILSGVGANSLSQSETGSLVVGSTNTSPPLDLFFIVDNSASMSANNVNLQAAFSKLFTNNSASLSNFNTRIFLFSTNSTFSGASGYTFPHRSPASISMMPDLSRPNSETYGQNLAALPGGLFSVYQTDVQENNFRLFPAPVLGIDPISNAVTGNLQLPQGNSSDLAYLDKVNRVSEAFKRRLSYLDPSLMGSAEDTYQNPLQVSSGLCTMARILKNADTFVQAGDAAAFVILSDDDDRLFDRNYSGATCQDGQIDQTPVVAGYCGNNRYTYAYTPPASEGTTTLTVENYAVAEYKIPGTIFNYQVTTDATCSLSGTVNYEYSAKYLDGYNYKLDYKLPFTEVAYQQLVYRDGIYQSPDRPATAHLPGDYTTACNSGNLATIQSSFGSQLDHWDPKTVPTCVLNNIPQNAIENVDHNSSSTACSSSVQAPPGALSVLCTITGPHTVEQKGIDLGASGNGSCSASLLGQLPSNANCSTSPHRENKFYNGLCANTTCEANGFLTGCQMNTNAGVTSTKSFQFNGSSSYVCADQCPKGSPCEGQGTIGSYIAGLKGTCHDNDRVAVQVQDSKAQSVRLSVNTGVDFSGAALNSCNQIFPNDIRLNECLSATSFSACVASLSPGSTCQFDYGGTYDIPAIQVPNLTGSTPCSETKGYCTGSQTVAQFLRTSHLIITSTHFNPPGPVALQYSFKNSSLDVQSANCNSLCKNTLNGYCHSLADANQTIGQYIQSLGGSCNAPSKEFYSTGSLLPPVPVSSTTAIPNSNCQDPLNPVFQASGQTVNSRATFAAGGSSPVAADFKNYIFTTAKSVFGANNFPTIAVIGHMTGDNLSGATSVSKSYFSVANPPTAISSVTQQDYSGSLAQISNLIQSQVLYSYVLNMNPNAQVFSLAVVRSGTNEMVPMPGATWTVSGTTLTVSPQANLQPGDRLIYKYQSLK